MIDQLFKHISPGSNEVKATSRLEKRQETLKSVFPLAFDKAEEWEAAEKEHSAYPNIRYWDEMNYNYDAAVAASSGIKFPKKYLFLEDAHGQLIPESRLNDMRAHLLEAFEDIRLLMPSLLHSNGWLKCDGELQTICYTDMRRRFPELNYCSKGWKARKLLSNWYSNYIKSRKKGESSIPVPEGDDEIELTAVIPAKRSLAHDPAKANKARKKVKKEKAEEKLEVDSDMEASSDVDINMVQIVDPL